MQATIPGEPLAARDFALEERSRLELALPAYLFVLMLHQLPKEGLGLRTDVRCHLDNAAVLPLVGLDELSVARLAKRLDDMAHRLLHELAPDDARQGLLIIAHFVLMLVDEGLFDDARNQAVLTALLLIDEAREAPGPSPEGGDEPDWAYDEARLQILARPLLGKTQLLGLYCR